VLEDPALNGGFRHFHRSKKRRLEKTRLTSEALPLPDDFSMIAVNIYMIDVGARAFWFRQERGGN
jgi:hypothetical protein